MQLPLQPPGPSSSFSVSNPLSYKTPQPPPQQQFQQQRLGKQTGELEFRKYSTKLYHLQRTIKSLVYKNGALSDELARLNQRIYTVSEERKMLAKRLQHHERNRIRRIQTQQRKAAAAARKKANEEKLPEGEEGELPVKVEIKEESRRKRQKRNAIRSSSRSSSSESSHTPLAIAPQVATSSLSVKPPSQSLLEEGMTLRSRSTSSTDIRRISPTQRSDRRSSTSTYNSSMNSSTASQSNLPQQRLKATSTENQLISKRNGTRQSTRQQMIHPERTSNKEGSDQPTDDSSPVAQKTKTEPFESVNDAEEEVVEDAEV